MAGGPEEGGPVGTISPRRPFESLLLVLNSIGTAWIFVLMVVINIDVIGRTLFTKPLPGVPELVRLSIVAIVFLQIGSTLRAGRVTRIDTFANQMAARQPRAAALLQATYSLIGAGVFLILFNACRPLFWRAWEKGEYAGVEGYVTYPFWPVYLVLLIGCACSAIQFLVFAWGDLRKVAAGRPGGPSGGASGKPIAQTEII